MPRCLQTAYAALLFVALLASGEGAQNVYCSIFKTNDFDSQVCNIHGGGFAACSSQGYTDANPFVDDTQKCQTEINNLCNAYGFGNAIASPPYCSEGGAFCVGRLRAINIISFCDYNDDQNRKKDDLPSLYCLPDGSLTQKSIDFQNYTASVWTVGTPCCRDVIGTFVTNCDTVTRSSILALNDKVVNKQYNCIIPTTLDRSGQSKECYTVSGNEYLYFNLANLLKKYPAQNSSLTNLTSSTAPLTPNNNVQLTSPATATTTHLPKQTALNAATASTPTIAILVVTAATLVFELCIY